MFRRSRLFADGSEMLFARKLSDDRLSVTDALDALLEQRATIELADIQPPQ